MHKISPFFLLIFLMPFYAYGANCSLNTAHDGCVSYDGCEYNEPDAFNDIPESCTECRAGFFNLTSQNSFQCTLCGYDSFPNTVLDGKEWDSNDTSTGNTECQWKCASGWFVDNNHTSCITCPNNNTAPTSYTNNDDAHIGDCTCNDGNTYLIQTTENSTNSYYCGQCGVGVQPNTNNGISTCTCPPTAIRVHGQTVSSYRLECACPSGANWDSNRCKCSAGKYLSPGTDGVYSCESCPSNGNCPEGSTWESATCTTGYKKVTNTTDHTFTCESCSDSNATLHGNVCKCNAGYYGTQNGLDTECKQCPTGTTTTIGATQRNECQMNDNTKFCYGSDDNKKCMNLIPADTVIYAPNNT